MASQFLSFAQRLFRATAAARLVPSCSSAVSICTSIGTAAEQSMVGLLVIIAMVVAIK